MLEGPRASVQSNKGAYLLLGASLVVLIASAKLCDSLNTCMDEMGWAVACSAVSVAFTFFFCVTALFRQSLCDAGAPYLSAFLAVWWFPGETHRHGERTATHQGPERSAAPYVRFQPSF